MFMLLFMFNTIGSVTIPLSLVVYLFVLLLRATLPRYRMDSLVKLVWRVQLFWAIASIVHLITLCL